MNSTFNSWKLPTWLCAWAIAALALGMSGCTDHGPVGNYSEELFKQYVAPPHMDFSSTSQLTFTVQTGALGNSAGQPFPFYVYLINDGGSSTYGPIVVQFYVHTAQIPYMNFIASYGMTAAIGADGTGQEIPANGTTLTLERGYVLAGVPTVSDITCSLQFYSTKNYVNGATYTPVIIDMLIKDGLGETWTNQCTVYVNT